MRYFTALILLFAISGCSSLRWTRYLDSNSNSEWKVNRGLHVSRNMDFEQESWQYQAFENLIKIQPVPLRSYTITMGPAYLPVVPFFQFIILADLIRTDEEHLTLELSVKSSNRSSFIDLRKIKASIIESDKIDSEILIDADSSSIIQWEPLDLKSTDSKKYLIPLSEKPYIFRVRFFSPINITEKVKIIINGLNSNGIDLDIPELFLFYKGKLYYSALEFPAV